MVATIQQGEFPSSDDAVNVGVGLLEAGCEHPSVIQLASSEAWYRTWGDLAALFDQVLIDVGIDTSPHQVRWAVLRGAAQHVISLTNVRELGWALRALLFNYWDGELRHADLDQVMVELLELEDEWERTVLQRRGDLVGEVKARAHALVELSEAGLRGQVLFEEGPKSSASGREDAPIATSDESSQVAIPAVGQNLFVAAVSKLVDWLRG